MLEALKAGDWVNPALLTLDEGFAPAEKAWFAKGELDSAANAVTAEQLEELEALALAREDAGSARTPVLACLALTGLMLIGLPIAALASRPVATTPAAETLAAPTVIAPPHASPPVVPSRPLDKAAQKLKAKLARAEVKVNGALVQLEKEKARSKGKLSLAVRKAEARLKASRAEAARARLEFVASAK